LGVLKMLALWFFPGWRLLYGLPDHDFIASLEAFQVAAVWLVTSSEPGRPRADSPQISRRWARWLCVGGYGVPMAVLCIPPFLANAWNATDASFYWAQSVGFLMRAVAVVCLLIMLRAYAMRNAHKTTARLLTCAATFGGLDVLAIVASALLVRIISPTFYYYWTLPLIAVAVVYWCAVMWAGARFSLGMARAVRYQRPRLRLGRTVVYVMSALVAGGIAGQLVAELLYIQGRRGGEFDLGLMRMGWPLWRLGVIAGMALLPNRIAMLHRRLTRWRHRPSPAIDERKR
jgi:hypothetical protein